MSNYFSKPLLGILVSLSPAISFAQSGISPVNSTTQPIGSSVQQVDPRIEIDYETGSFFSNLENSRIPVTIVAGKLNEWLKLSADYTFIEQGRHTDRLGIDHVNYKQLYKGIPVESSLVLVHSKNGILTLINGMLHSTGELTITTGISKETAVVNAKNHLGVTKLIREYPVETVFARIPSEGTTKMVLTQKVRIDSYSPFEMCNLFLDMQTGEVLRKINLMADADVDGTAKTYYAGTQNITSDSVSAGSYRLRETARNIETYDASNTDDYDTTGFIGAVDFTNDSKDWQKMRHLASFTVSTITGDWWKVGGDNVPDLYIKVIDGTGEAVFVSPTKTNTNPSITFPLNICMINPPYKVELWDHQASGGDNFGSTFDLSTLTGLDLAWADLKDSGVYTIDTVGHPAYDAHWGMEITHDFYKNNFGRDSYDGLGSVIKQFVNTPLLQTQHGNSPNNASAFPDPYNFMQYGLGDGVQLNPVVGIDVEGHEFTHIIVDHNGTGGLTYQGESGALNESFADIFGTSIEFYSGENADWNIGTNIRVGGGFLRNMANPNDAQNPDTYGGKYWIDPASFSDNGGVHYNSGVQNFWYYLLTEGGTGTNDINDAYAVTGIGIGDAAKIVYQSLTNYLTPAATYMDAYHGSLQAATDLFGATSAQYQSVVDAWFAVGIPKAVTPACSGTTTLTTPTGTFTDNSGTSNYTNNTNCKWLISPAGAGSITLSFSDFKTEANRDFVKIYNGSSNASPLLLSVSGGTLPASVSSNGGVMYVEFKSNATTNDLGWTANYTSSGLGINEQNERSVSIYPNPGTGIFTISSGLPIKGYTVMNAEGRVVQRVSGLTDITASPDLSAFANGLYTILVQTEQSVERLPVVLQK